MKRQDLNLRLVHKETNKEYYVNDLTGCAEYGTVCLALNRSKHDDVDDYFDFELLLQENFDNLEKVFYIDRCLGEYDIKGNLVYENDLLSSFENPQGSDIEQTVRPIWFNLGWCLDSDYGGNIDPLMPEQTKDFYVIGNAHNNGDLFFDPAND